MKLTFLNRKPAKADARIMLARAFGLLLALLLTVSLAAPALAVPQPPHWFYGTVYVDNAPGDPPLWLLAAGCRYDCHPAAKSHSG